MSGQRLPQLPQKGPTYISVPDDEVLSQKPRDTVASTLPLSKNSLQIRVKYPALRSGAAIASTYFSGYPDQLKILEISKSRAYPCLIIYFSPDI